MQCWKHRLYSISDSLSRSFEVNTMKTWIRSRIRNQNLICNTTPILMGRTTLIRQYQKFIELLEKNLESKKKTVHKGGGGGVEENKNCDKTNNFLIWAATKQNLRIGAVVTQGGNFFGIRSIRKYITFLLLIFCKK